MRKRSAGEGLDERIDHGSSSRVRRLPGPCCGTFTGRDGEEALENVTFSDATLSFTRTTESQGMVVALEYSATVEGDTMTLEVATPRGERSDTAQRAGRVPRAGRIVSRILEVGDLERAG